MVGSWWGKGGRHERDISNREKREQSPGLGEGRKDFNKITIMGNYKQRLDLRVHQGTNNQELVAVHKPNCLKSVEPFTEAAKLDRPLVDKML